MTVLLLFCAGSSHAQAVAPSDCIYISQVLIDGVPEATVAGVGYASYSSPTSWQVLARSASGTWYMAPGDLRLNAFQYRVSVSRATFTTYGAPTMHYLSCALWGGRWHRVVIRATAVPPW